MINQPHYNSSFIKIEIKGKKRAFTTKELKLYFLVNFSATSFVPQSHYQKVKIQLDQAARVYQPNPAAQPNEKQATNQSLFTHIPPTGIETIPDYLYLKPIYLNEVPQLGVYSSIKLEAGSWIGTYAGEILPKDYPTRSLHAMSLLDPFAKTDLQVDGKNWGNHTRFLNHSYKPNIIRNLIFYKNMYHVILYTIRTIAPNEQLVYDYGQPYWEKLGVEPLLL